MTTVRWPSSLCGKSRLRVAGPRGPGADSTPIPDSPARAPARRIDGGGDVGYCGDKRGRVIPPPGASREERASWRTGS